eukprot:288454-Pelagomonas_calceolata.AAC.1
MSGVCVAGYNVWMHQGAEDTDDGTTPQTLTVQHLIFLSAKTYIVKFSPPNPTPPPYTCHLP